MLIIFFRFFFICTFTVIKNFQVSIDSNYVYISRRCFFQSVDCIDCCDDSVSSSFFFFLNLLLIFFNVIFPHIGESFSPSIGLFVTQSNFVKSGDFLNFFTGLRQAVATIPLVLNLLCNLYGVFFNFVCMISVFERTIAFGLLVLCVKALSGDSDVERFSAGNLVCYFFYYYHKHTKKEK